MEEETQKHWFCNLIKNRDGKRFLRITFLPDWWKLKRVKTVDIGIDFKRWYWGFATDVSNEVNRTIILRFGCIFVNFYLWKLGTDFHFYTLYTLGGAIKSLCVK